ncbi:hypothetical protein MN608_07671 [Microdochium nivale]|nr:hypothetical protein MN608_07671 [Microdochium nivale]
MEHKRTRKAEAEAEAEALASMMNDLGLSRAEEVATEIIPHGSRRPPRPVIQPQAPDATQKNNMWTNAVREGLFKDSDYDSVKQLDPISNGNLHRENRISKVIGQLLEGDDRYDPTQPGYRGGKRKRNTVRDIPVDPNFQVSALGVLLPPGMTTKRWEPSTKNNSVQASQVSVETCLKDNQSLSNPLKADEGLESPPANKQRETAAATLPLGSLPNQAVPAHYDGARPVTKTIPSGKASASSVAITPSGVPPKVTKAKPTSSRPLVSMPNRPVPRHYNDNDVATKSMPDTKRAAPPVVTRQPGVPPKVAKAKMASSRPLVSMPACPIPQRPEGEGIQQAKDIGACKRQASVFSDKPRESKGQEVPLSSRPQTLSQVFFSTSASLQVLVGGKAQNSPLQLEIGLRNSTDPVATLILTENDSNILEATVGKIPPPVQHNRTIFMRYFREPGQTETVQVMFENVALAEAFTDALEKSKKNPRGSFDRPTAPTGTPPHAAAQVVAEELANTVREEEESSFAAAQYDQILADNEIQDALLKLHDIEAVIVNANINTPEAQRCLALVYSVADSDYAALTQTSRNLVGVLRRIILPCRTPLLETAALQASLMHLMRIDEFRDLPLEEKKRALAIVYRRVL